MRRPYQAVHPFQCLFSQGLVSTIFVIKPSGQYELFTCVNCLVTQFAEFDLGIASAGSLMRFFATVFEQDTDCCHDLMRAPAETLQMHIGKLFVTRLFKNRLTLHNNRVHTNDNIWIRQGWVFL